MQLRDCENSHTMGKLFALYYGTVLRLYIVYARAARSVHCNEQEFFCDNAVDFAVINTGKHSLKIR